MIAFRVWTAFSLTAPKSNDVALADTCGTTTSTVTLLRSEPTKFVQSSW
jgi:hypothetical protein